MNLMMNSQTKFHQDLATYLHGKLHVHVGIHGGRLWPSSLNFKLTWDQGLQAGNRVKRDRQFPEPLKVNTQKKVFLPKAKNTITLSWIYYSVLGASNLPHNHPCKDVTGKSNKKNKTWVNFDWTHPKQNM